MPRVSVVIASYNHAPFVEQAVRSVLDQSFQDLELVITDDGSKDGTPDVVRSIEDPRIFLKIFSENRGACAAINDAIQRARGEYVAILNSDDYFLPGKLERQVEFLDKSPDICAVFGLPNFVEESGRNLESAHPMAGLFFSENMTSNAWLRRFFLHGNCLCHPTVMVRKSLYQAVGGFDVSLRQLPDLDLWIRTCIYSNIHVLPEKLTAFRLMSGEGNTSAPNLKNSIRHEWEMVSVLERFLDVPDERLRDIFSDDVGVELCEKLSAKEILARMALKVGSPAYNFFAMSVLKRCVGESGGVRSGEFFRLIESVDPMGVRVRFCIFTRIWLRLRKVIAVINGTAG